MYRRMLYAYYYIRAKRCLIKKDFLCAYNNFLKAEKYYKDDYSLYVYKGVSEFMLKQFESALNSFQKALFKIENNNKLDKENRNYLKKYIIGYIVDILKVLGNEINLNRYKRMYESLDYDENKVNKYFFYDYPI